jgi:hypothetical protein
MKTGFQPIAILGLVWVTSPAVAQSQSCAAADSTVGAHIDAKALGRPRYDPVSDTTIMQGKGMINVPMLGLPTMVELNTYWQGKASPSIAKSLVLFSVSQAGQGPDMQRITKEEALYADVDAALLLLDDSVRIRLPRLSYRAHLDQGKLGLMKQLVEDLSFDISNEQLRQIGRARAGLIRIGPSQLKINAALSASARETLRFRLCSAAISRP